MEIHAANKTAVGRTFGALRRKNRKPVQYSQV